MSKISVNIMKFRIQNFMFAIACTNIRIETTDRRESNRDRQQNSCGVHLVLSLIHI